MKQAIRRVIPQRDHGFAVSLMEHLVVPTFVIGADRRVLIWNKACERLTGVPARKKSSARRIIGAPSTPTRRPCLADLLLERRFNEIGTLYESGGSLRSERFRRLRGKLVRDAAGSAVGCTWRSTRARSTTIRAI